MATKGDQQYAEELAKAAMTPIEIDGNGVAHNTFSGEVSRILAEVRQQERDRIAEFVRESSGSDGRCHAGNLAAAIRTRKEV